MCSPSEVLRPRSHKGATTEAGTQGPLRPWHGLLPRLGLTFIFGVEKSRAPQRLQESWHMLKEWLHPFADIF